MKNVIMLLPDRNAHYRARLPHRFLASPAQDLNVNLTLTDTLHSNEPFDAVILHHDTYSVFLPYFDQLQERGTKIAIDLSRDHWHPAPWHPQPSTADLSRLDEALDKCDLIIANTELLARVIGRPGETVVCPDLLDLDEWPTSHWQHSWPHSERVRILWAGGPENDGDFAGVEPALVRLLAERDDFDCVFIGNVPPALSGFQRINYGETGRLVVRPEYEKRVRYIPGSCDPSVTLPLLAYSSRLCDAGGTIGICPYAPCDFNYSRSGIRSMELCLAGCAVLTQLPSQDPELWHVNLSTLLNDASQRIGMHKHQRESAVRNFTWQGHGGKEWLEALRRLT